MKCFEQARPDEHPFGRVLGPIVIGMGEMRGLTMCGDAD